MEDIENRDKGIEIIQIPKKRVANPNENKDQKETDGSFSSRSNGDNGDVSKLVCGRKNSCNLGLTKLKRVGYPGNMAIRSNRETSDMQN